MYMRIQLCLLSILMMTSAVAKDMSNAEANVRRRNIKKFSVKADTRNYCQENLDNVKHIRRLISEQKSGDKNLFELEKEFDSLRAEQTLIDGLVKLNNNYKDFLDKASQAKIPGIDGKKNFSLNQLEADLKESQDHFHTVAIMATMDELIKSSIGNPEDLFAYDKDTNENNNNPDVLKDLRDGSIDQRNAVLKNGGKSANLLKMDDDTSGAEIFAKLKKDSCTSGNKSNFCKIIAQADTPEATKKIEATVEGFVNAYRLSKRNPVVKFTRNLFIDDLQNYRDVLLDGIEGATPEEKAVSLAKMTDGYKGLEKYTSFSENADSFKTLADDIHKYKGCLLKKSFAVNSGKCKLRTTPDTVNLVANLEGLRTKQLAVVAGLDGDNKLLKAQLTSARGHNKAVKRLSLLEKAYAGEDKIQKAITAQIEKTKGDLTNTTANILRNINLDRGSILSHKAAMGGESSLEDYIAGKSKYSGSTNEDIDTSNEKLNNLLAKMRLQSCNHKKSPTEKSICTSDKEEGENKFFKVVDGKMTLDPQMLENFLDEVNEGNLLTELTKEKDALDKKVTDIKQKIDAARSSDQNKVLQSLLTFYGDRASSYCSQDKNKSAEWKCVQGHENKNEKVHALVGSTGEILARMPASPQSLSISGLSQQCNTDFMKGFKAPADSKIVTDMCNQIFKENENYLTKLEPTKEEKEYLVKDRYWDGKQWVSHKRKKWYKSAATSVAVRGLNFLPWELNRRMEMSQVENWETNTIAGLQYRNDMLSNYYTGYGIQPGYYYGGGYFGGSIYDNTYSTAGTGGYFPLTTTTGAGSASPGFAF